MAAEYLLKIWIQDGETAGEWTEAEFRTALHKAVCEAMPVRSTTGVGSYGLEKFLDWSGPLKIIDYELTDAPKEDQ